MTELREPEEAPAPVDGVTADDQHAWSIVLVSSARFGASLPLAEWQLARALARRRRVLFVDPPTFLHRVPRGDGVPWPTVRAVAPNLYLLRPVAPPGADRPSGAALGDLALDRQIAHAAHRFLTGRRVIVTAEPRRGLLAGVERDALLYWQRDRVAAASSARHTVHLNARHLNLAVAADVVAGVSPALLQDVEAIAPRTMLLPNGCDFEHFATSQPPVEPRGDRVMIGFAGGLSWRVDLDLLCGVADARPAWDLVLVGEVATDVPARPNLRVLGRCGYDRLPGWLQAFDVGIIPYRTDAFNRASFPLKVYEYLAAGRPVVSTPLPALSGLAPHVRVADGASAFVAAVEEALERGPGEDSCQEVARRNSWDARARSLDERVASLLT